MPISRRLLWLSAVPFLAFACAVQSPHQGDLHRWWAKLGPVVKHDTFPADCKLCHLGPKWNELVADFQFDHEKQTGVPLLGAHQNAHCLRCHNDRGPVAAFQAQGCAGCHEDTHYGELGKDCNSCHDNQRWQVDDMRARHYHTRFPLTGPHLGVACHRCHPGATMGNFLPTGPRCENCHLHQALATTNPPHAGLGWTSDCQRCHPPSRWKLAVVR
jgi:hypothetical protein